MHLSLEKTEDLVRKAWRSLGILRKDSWSFPNPVTPEEESRKTTIDDVRSNFHICKNWKGSVDAIETY